jgi:Kdo2-lipid IVA lauroyltransferase/acyltransferase
MNETEVDDSIDWRLLYKRFKYTIIYGFVRFLIFCSKLVPRITWIKFCGWLGTIAYHLDKRSRERTIAHLGLAYAGEKTTKEILALSKETWKMLGRNGGDMIRALSIKNIDDLNKMLVLHDFENFDVAHAKGKGVIFLTCHVGAFDLQVTVYAMMGLKPLIIGTRLKDDRLNDLLWKHRNAHGAVAIERGKETFRLVKELKAGGSLAILIDQDTKVKSRFVNFFGMQASTPVGATVFAMKTGAAIVPTFIHLGEDYMQHMYTFPEIPMILTGDEEHDIVVNTQRLTTHIENVIRQHPSQWVWMHERWKTKPGEEVV